MQIDENILSKISAPAEFNKYLILKYLSLSGNRHGVTEKEIHLYLRENGRGLNSDKSTVVNKYLTALKKAELVYSRKQTLPTDDFENSTIQVNPVNKWYPLNPREFAGMDVDRDQLPYLVLMRSMLQKFNFLPFYDYFEEFIHEQQLDIEEYHGKQAINEFKIVDFDTRDTFDGIDHIGLLYVSIEEQDSISFDYKHFDKDEPESILHVEPYLLKEHMNRWYLIAMVKGKLERFDLARIKRILVDTKEHTFYRDPEFNPDEIGKHSMGISTYWWKMIQSNAAQIL